MGNKTRIAAAAVSAVMALSVVPQAAFATNGDSERVASYLKISTRLGGLDRAQTATKIADAYRQNVDTVILTVGRNFPDALAATPLSDQLDAPILLNDGAELNQPTAEWLFDNAPDVREIIIVGGSGVIPQSVIDDIKDVYQQRKVAAPSFVRYSGVDRNETAYQVSARTVAGYYDRGYCTSTGVTVSYTEAQKQAAEDLAEADAVVASYEQILAEYAEAKAAYEATKAAYDASVDARDAALEAWNAAIAALEAITKQLQEVPELAPLYAAVQEQGQEIARISAETARIQSLDGKLRAILAAAVQPGAVENEEDVWEWLYGQSWDHVLQQLPEFADDIAAVTAEWPSATVGGTREQANADVADAEADLTAGQNAYAEAVKALDDALAADAANAALREAISAASAKVVAAKKAYDDAEAAKEAAWEAYVEAAEHYAGYVDNPALVPGALVRAKAAQQKAVDAVVAAADNVPVFLATGRDFADALTAGPAAADQCGVILLTENTEMSAASTKWVNAAKPHVVSAIGGQARTAAGSAATISHVGKDRFDTAKKVNLHYLNDRKVVGIATGYDYPDALTGAALAANADGGLLLVRTNEVPDYTREALAGGNWTKPVIFGGTAVVSPAVSTQINQILN